ncbi:MAG: hypothetical protein LCH26_07725, partial [Proteobacteria bacterium]|nr:hypothetical protein [Pseudomonadota bacterium]
IDNTLCSSMPLDAFPMTDDAGDGDKVFANMLHYIKDNFQTSPDALTAYEAPKNDRFSSPQMRMHTASLLRKQLPGTVNVIEQANRWDEIYKTFDHIFFYESHVAAAIYGLAGDAETDPQKKAHFYAKSAQLYDSHHSALPELKAQGVYTVASAYHKAGFFALQQSEKEKYFSKAAQWYSRHLDKLAQPPADALRVTALAHSNLALVTLDPSRRIHAFLACASYWDAFFEKTQTPKPDDMKTASSVYRTIADTTKDPAQRTAYLNKCAALFQRHLAYTFPLRNPS